MKQKYKEFSRVIFTSMKMAAFAVVLIAVGLYGESQEATDGMLALPIHSKKINEKNYKEVVGQLEGAGFTNIRTEKIEDLSLGFFKKDGQVESVSVAGSLTFSKGVRFQKDVPITIVYHTFKQK